MTRYGFHASHEQVPARHLLADVQRAERAGFEVAMCSDHFSPWSRRQAHCAFAWSWLGAALARTNLTFGVVNAPGQRYHPAVLAHAMATLGSMFPGRFWWPWEAARPSTSTSPATVGRARRSGSDGSRSASTSSGGCEV